jgi:hypothetical protein
MHFTGKKNPNSAPTSHTPSSFDTGLITSPTNVRALQNPLPHNLHRDTKVAFRKRSQAYPIAFSMDIGN